MPSVKKTKQATFVSELYLFSDQIHEGVEDWFFGNFIEYIDLHQYDQGTFEVCSLFCECLKQLNRQYRYATRIINYNDQGLVFAKLTTRFEAHLKINSTLTLSKLRSVNFAMLQADEAVAHFTDAIHTLESTKRYCGSINDVLLKSELSTVQRDLELYLVKLKSTRDRVHNAFLPTFGG
jgi:hypothetical protein